jgi:hypothetical protein
MMGKSLTAEEKQKQIEKAQGASQDKESLTPEASAAIFAPEPVIIKVGDRPYTLSAMKLRQTQLLIRLTKLIRGTTVDNIEETIDKIAEGLSQLLKEPDREFLMDNLDMPLIQRILAITTRLTYMGIPLGGPPKGKAGEAGEGTLDG